MTNQEIETKRRKKRRAEKRREIISTVVVFILAALGYAISFYLTVNDIDSIPLHAR